MFEVISEFISKWESQHSLGVKLKVTAAFFPVMAVLTNTWLCGRRVAAGAADETVHPVCAKSSTNTTCVTLAEGTKRGTLEQPDKLPQK